MAPPSRRKHQIGRAPVYRATMIDLAFQGLPKVWIELLDLEAGEYSPAGNILEKITFHGDFRFILRPDMISGGAMGAAPLPLSAAALLLVGSNVLFPVFWQPAVLPLNSRVEFRTLDPLKRPLNGFVDGVPQGKVSGICIKTSNIAAVELAFDTSHDPAEKLARIQSPAAADP